MKFLDRKEQVLELKVTQYGKSLLSRGVFYPVYYSFFDDDVIYDSNYMNSGSVSPLENSSKEADRIKKALRTEPQYNYSGVETNILKLSEVSEDQAELTLEEKLQELSKPPSAIDNYYSLGLPMGTSKYNTDKAPAWSLKFSNGEIVSPVTDYTGSSGLLKIPQLQVEGYYNTYVGMSKTNAGGYDSDEDESNMTFFEDGSTIKIEKDCILIDFSEFNSLFENENYEIEVYEIIEQPDSNKIKEDLKPLKFISKEKLDSNVYYSEETTEHTNINANHVEFFLDITVDDEITDDIGLSDTLDTYKSIPENDEEPC